MPDGPQLAPRIEPMAGARTPLTGKQKGGAAAIALAIIAAVSTASPLTETKEGFKGAVYFDPAHIATQCFGETEGIDPTRVFSKSQCAAKLRTRMARDYAPPIIKCVPSFVDPKNRHAFAASLDASYNAGPVAVCRSPMAKAFNAGNYRAGCNAFPGWYVSALNRQTGKRIVFPGLVKRRADERTLCLSTKGTPQ